MLDLCKKCGIERPNTNDYKLIKDIAEEIGIKLHFTYFNGDKKITKSPKKELNEILCENSNYPRQKLKIRLFKEGIKTHKCEKCGRTEWEGEPIPLELHHINGVYDDNRIENIKMLCPNCHALTENFGGKNRKKENTTKFTKSAKKTKTKEEWSKIKNNIWIETHPSKEEFINNFKKIGSISGIGKFYGVSDAAIKKWLIHYGLPTHIKDLSNILRL